MVPLQPFFLTIVLIPPSSSCPSKWWRVSKGQGCWSTSGSQLTSVAATATVHEVAAKATAKNNKVAATATVHEVAAIATARNNKVAAKATSFQIETAVRAVFKKLHVVAATATVQDSNQLLQ